MEAAIPFWWGEAPEWQPRFSSGLGDHQLNCWVGL